MSSDKTAQTTVDLQLTQLLKSQHFSQLHMIPSGFIKLWTFLCFLTKGSHSYSFFLIILRQEEPFFPINSTIVTV
jgi:hypothetical protein